MDAEMIVAILQAIWRTLSAMAPYLLLGFGISGLLAVFLSPAVVERHLGGRRFGAILKAALFGIPLPLCSCGVIPVAVSLRKHGAGRGATTAFLLSTPQTGADSIMVTYSLLGPVFALFRPIAALATGLLGGTLVDLLVKEDGTAGRPTCEDACCAGGTQTNRWKHAFMHAFVSLPNDIGGAMVFGILIAALIAAFVRDSWIQAALAPGIGAMLIMMVAGIPVYVCATASVPIAAALIAKGVSPGAALVFLMTGPATNGAAIATLWRTLGARTALLYLLTVAVSALLCGLSLDQLVLVTGAAQHLQPHPMLPEWGHTVCAVALLAILGHAWMRRMFRGRRKTVEGKKTTCRGGKE